MSFDKKKDLSHLFKVKREEEIDNIIKKRRKIIK